MTLAIDHFVTRCRASPRAGVDRCRIDRIVRTEFVDSCARELASTFRGHTGVVRIRRLSVKLALARRQLGEAAFGRQWAATFAASLKRALALPDGAGPLELRRFESRADWLAAALAAVLQGDAATRWEFAELTWLASASLAEAVNRILDLDFGNTATILLRLHVRGGLDALLISLDEAALAQVMQRLDAELVAAAPLSAEDLIEIAGHVVQRTAPFASERLVSRRRALSLWAALADGQYGHWTPRRVAAALNALDLSIAAFGAQSSGDLATHLLWLNDDALDDRTKALIGHLLRVIGAAARGDHAARDVLDRLATALTRLAQAFPTHVAKGKRVASDVAGLLLLVPSVIRLDWPTALQTTALWARHGPRSLTYLLAAIGHHLLTNGRSLNVIEPATAIFAGWMGEPDLAGYRRFSDGVTPDDCRELSRALGVSLGGSSVATPDAGWPALVSAAGDRLVGEFASRIRGFGESSRAFVMRKLLAVPGEIVIEERRLQVALASCPFHVALHVASMFETVGSVSWLGFRDLVFRPGGT